MVIPYIVGSKNVRLSMRYIFSICVVVLVLCGNALARQQQPTPGYTVSGVVTDSTSGETVVGAAVYITKDSVSKPLRGAITNKFGFFSIPNIADGTYILNVSLIGYKKQRVPIVVSGKTKRIDVSIVSQARQAQQVTVTADKETPTSTISTVTVTPQFIQQMPSLGGEVDVFRVLQLLPGVKSASEISSGLYVRGGSPDQNLTLLDGVIVYNPSHLGGFLSTFNSDALKDIKLIKGGFPAEYGGRLSSVLDLTMREGTKEKISGTAGISLIASRAMVEGPINKESTFMISGRRMYLDVLLAMLSPASRDETPTYYFYDLNAKVNYKLGENDRLFVSGYFGKDVLAEPKRERDQGSTFGIDWGNSTANIRWMHIHSDEVFTNFSAIYTDYSFNTSFGEHNPNTSSDFTFSTLSQIRDYMARGELQYFPAAEHRIKAGFETILHKFTANASDSLAPNSNELIFRATTKNAFEGALYVQDEWDATENLTTNLGGRLYYFNQGNYFQFEPRLSAAYSLTPESRINASFAMAHQFLHLIVRNDIALPTDLWFPSTETIKPSRSIQGTLGYETTLNDNEYKLSVEAYYKDMRNLYEYRDTANFSLGLPLESQFTVGRGEAYGAEVFLNKQVGSFTGWIGYTLSWTKRYFDELNNGKPFYPRYDRRHDVSIALTYRIGESWELGATWVYGTGQAYTMPTGVYVIPNYPNNGLFGDRIRYDYSERNGYRLPAFHKMDLNFMHSFSWFKLPWQVSINIYNAYNHKNPFAQYIATEYDNTTQSSKKVVKQITLFPLIPTFGLSVKF